jgi:ribosomal protein S18 acetylase RimI-like enzyme
MVRTNPLVRSLDEPAITVQERIVIGNEIGLRLENGSEVGMRRFAPVGEGDRIAKMNGWYWIVIADSEELLRLTPAWVLRTKMTLGSESYLLTIKEIETEEEYSGYKRLTEYHYRGGGGIGRCVPLVASIETQDLPNVVGFVELSSSFLVNSARKKVFDSQFSDPEHGIAWVRWDTRTARKFANIFVRISRCVVFPELRGVGLSTKLLEAAVTFSKERWHIGGKRPSFIEITADMLRISFCWRD